MGFVAERVKTMTCPECGHEFDPNAVKPLAMIPCPKCGISVQTPARFGKFLLKKRLGIGPSGIVFQAFDEQLHRTVALKILKSGGEDEKMAQQFIREARTLASLNHQNIVRIYDLGQFREQHYIEMEVVTGGSVKDYLKASKKPDELEIIDLAISVADALNAAKQAQLVHTNIEPGTILLDEKKQPKLIDFGFGHYLDDSKTGSRSASFIYIAPEVVRGSQHNFKSDLYNLGATMFHLLAGRPPFKGSTPKEVMEARFTGAVPKLSAYRRDLNPKTVQVVARLMSIDPDRRYQSYELLIEALFDARESRPAPTPVQSGVTAALAEAAGASGSMPTVAGASRSSRPGRSGRSGRQSTGPTKKPTNPLVFIIPGAGAAILLLVIVLVIANSGGKPPPPDNQNNFANNNDRNYDDSSDDGTTDSELARPDPPSVNRPTTTVVRPLNQDANQQFASNSNGASNPAPVQQFLRLHWSLDGTVRDDGGGSFHGINRGKIAYAKPGRIGSGALKLSGKEHISIQHNVDFLASTKKITLAAWVKLPKGKKQKQWAGIITKGDGSWRMGVTERTNGGFHFAFNAGKDDRINTKSTKYNDGLWHHIAGVYDGKVLSIYVDGKLDNSRKRSGVEIKSNTFDINIGNNAERPNRQLVGQIDEVLVYIDKALNARAIKKLYDAAPAQAGTPALVIKKEDPKTLVSTVKTGDINTVPKGKLLGYWGFEKDGADSTGIHRSRLIGGAKIVGDAKRGRVVEFDGKSGFVDLGSGYADFTGGLTFAVWAKPTAVTTWARFLDLGNGQDQHNVIFSRDAGKNDLVFTHQTARRAPLFIGSKDAIKLNVWQHFAVTMDAAGLVRLYKDGQLVSEGKNPQKPEKVIRMSNYAGRSNWATDNFFKGRMDQLLVYNRALTTQEIATLVKGGSTSLVAAVDPSLVGRWIMSADLTDRAKSLGLKDPTKRVIDQTGKLHATVLGKVQLQTVDGFEALKLDGSTNSVMVALDFKIAKLPTESITVESWVRVDKTQKWGGIVGAIQDNGDYERGWVLGFEENKFTFALASAGGGGSMTYLTAKTPFTTGTWYHVVGSYDGKVQKLFINGKLAGTSAVQKGAIIYPPDTFFEIGAYHDSDEYHRMLGYIHEVSVYRRALSDDEIAKRSIAKRNGDKQILAKKAKVTEPGLQAHWTFDQIKNNTITNAVGNKFGGMVIGGKAEPGTIGQCLTLDGTAGVRINDSQQMSLADKDYTISGWIKTKVDGTILSKAAANGTWAPQAKSLAIQSGKLIFAINQGGATIRTTTKISDDKWHHVAVTFEKAESKYRLYVDGKADGGGQLRTGPDPAGFITRIGFTAKNFGPPFKGSIDDLRFYTRRLNDLDIEKLFMKEEATSPAPPQVTGDLLAHWTFDKDSQNTIDRKFHGKAQNGTHVTGVLGKAISFRGTGEIVIADSNLLSFAAKDYSIAAWIKTKAGGTIIAKAPKTGKWVKGGKTFMVTGGKLVMDIGFVGAVTSSRKVDDDKWHHVAVTFNKAQNKYQLYIDGRTDSSGTLETVADPAGYVARIGFTASDFGPRFNGAIDDLRFYAKKISDQDVAALAKQVKLDTGPAQLVTRPTGTAPTAANYKTGKILAERWDGIAGEISELVKKIAIQPKPNSSTYYTKIESPRDKGDNYGIRVTGYLIPPKTGKYSFWIEADDRGQVFISENHSPESLIKVAEKGKASIPVDLQEGKYYYIKILHKEMAGGDYFKVGWKRSDGFSEFPIPGSRLSSKLPPSHAYTFIAIKPSEAKAQNVPLEIKEDHSILAGGTHKLNDVYTIRFDTNVSNMTAIQFYALPDPSLPGKGPGRGSGGMFTIDELIFSAAPRSAPTNFTPVIVATQKVDFAMRGFGLEKALDGKPKTFWGVRGRSGQQRIATFVFKKPVGGPNGTILKLTVRNNMAIGRFKLLATSYEKPWEIAGQASLAGGGAPNGAAGGATANAGANAGGAAKPNGPIRIFVNCGDISFTDSRGIKWVKAKAYKLGSFGWTGGGAIAKDDKEKDLLMKTSVANLDSFRFDVPNGKYRVTMFFSDHWSGRAGERVFSVTVQGKMAAEGLDLSQSPGFKKNLRVGPKIYEVKDGKLEIEFSAIVNTPLINAIAIEGLSSR